MKGQYLAVEYLLFFAIGVLMIIVIYFTFSNIQRDLRDSNMQEQLTRVGELIKGTVIKIYESAATTNSTISYNLSIPSKLSGCIYSLNNDLGISYVKTGNYSYDGWNFSLIGVDGEITGIFTNGTYFWSVGKGTDRVYRYVYNTTYENYSYDGWNFSVGAQDTLPEDLFFNGTYFWILGGNTNRVYRYSFNATYGNYSYDGWNFSVTRPGFPTGFFFNGTYFWIVRGSALPIELMAVHRYSFNATYGNYSYDGWNFSIGAHNLNPQGLTYNGIYFWILDENLGKLFRYSFNATYGNYSYDGWNITASSGNALFFNGTYFWSTNFVLNRVLRFAEILNPISASKLSLRCSESPVDVSLPLYNFNITASDIIFSTRGFIEITALNNGTIVIK